MGNREVIDGLVSIIMPSEYSCAVKPPFRDAGYRRSRDGVPQIV